MARSVSCQESLDLNDWQNNSHPKHAAACDWRRYHFSSIKVIKLVLEAGCFSERGYILGSPPGGNTTSSDSQPLNSNLSEEETYFKTLFIHWERNTPGRKEGKKEGWQGKHTQDNQWQKAKESPTCTLSPQSLVSCAKGEGTTKLQILVLTASKFLATDPDFKVFLEVEKNLTSYPRPDFSCAGFYTHSFNCTQLTRKPVLCISPVAYQSLRGLWAAGTQMDVSC